MTTGERFAYLIARYEGGAEKLSKKLRIDPTTIYYWIRDNRRPHEMAETLKELGSSESQFYADDFPVGIPHADVVAVAKPRRGRTKKKKARRG